ncbi:MAG: Uma2 family endonuclease [Gemmatimonadales bacterium]|nr:Uma2 family endonuclease [Gemmatimonadales bacterium]
MSLPVTLRRFTVDELERFPPDGNHYELLDGCLIVTAQAGLPHQTVATRLSMVLGAFFRQEPGIEVWARGAIEIRPDTHLEPDILIGKMPDIARWDAVRDHWLAVEICGVASRVFDREVKRDAYLQLGVKEVWRVDLDLRCIFVSRPGGPSDIHHDTTLSWYSPSGRELNISIPALFRGLPPGG